ncbi:MAG: TlpA family protein disulfide reductase [Acidobacteriota bacterium]|nr:TlpA family protein disulfide reductase [Acidobacteriota bacterium]
MKTLRLAVLFLTLGAPVAAQQLTGLWDATITVNGAQVPFRVQFSGSGNAFKAWFFDGDSRTVSTGGQSTPSSILARFDQYNSRLEATLKGGALDGTYTRDGKVYPVHAVPHGKPAPLEGKVPDIGGSWVIETGRTNGEKAWHLIVRQTGPEVDGAILRVDGDTGALTGRYEDGHFTMSHFSGARPSVFVLTPREDGSLDVLQNGAAKLTAVRAEIAKAKGLPGPDDPSQHITLRNPNEPLKFAFPDLDGHIVSSTDPRFKGKVVIVSIGGSWCPNCHDEAPLLVSLYRKYRNQGLEIVELSFEEEDQLKNPTRLRAFEKEYGINYTVLLAGEPSQLAEKLPQAVNLDTFPATFFVGRDGLVKAIHAGFTGPAMGALHDQLVEEINTTLAKLLAEK